MGQFGGKHIPKIQICKEATNCVNLQPNLASVSKKYGNNAEEKHRSLYGKTFDRLTARLDVKRSPGFLSEFGKYVISVVIHHNHLLANYEVRKNPSSRNTFRESEFVGKGQQPAYFPNPN